MQLAKNTQNITVGVMKYNSCNYLTTLWWTRSLGALQAPNSIWRPIGVFNTQPSRCASVANLTILLLYCRNAKKAFFLPEETQFTAFLSRMLRKSQNTLFENKTLDQIRLCKSCQPAYSISDGIILTTSNCLHLFGIGREHDVGSSFVCQVRVRPLHRQRRVIKTFCCPPSSLFQRPWFHYLG